MSNKCQLVSYLQKEEPHGLQKWLIHAVSLVAGGGFEPPTFGL